jgi:hypothetical protein
MYQHPSPTINAVSTSVLFADDTSIIITELDASCLAELSTYIFTVMNIWFIANKFTLNVKKTV